MRNPSQIRHDGSSPHTRGARSALRSAIEDARIIPAYAGSTGGTAARAAVLEDHPRIRGEHAGLDVNHRSDGGSSPHTRGARRRSSPASAVPRIIPAYAGSTPTRAAGLSIWRDHPRIRGEHQETPGANAWGLGSSPHTRGALHAEHCAVRVTGIIPAYAGSTWVLRR